MSAFLHKSWTGFCVVCKSVTYVIKHLNKGVLKKYQCTFERLQYVCRKLGVGTGKLNSIRMLAAYHSDV